MCVCMSIDRIHLFWFLVPSSTPFSFLSSFLLFEYIWHTVLLVSGVQQCFHKFIHYPVLTTSVIYHLSPYSAVTVSLTVFSKLCLLFP